MYNSIRPYLFRLDPEHAHALTLHALRITGNFAPSRWIMEQLFKSPPKPVEAFGLTFRNPVGIAAGYDKDGGNHQRYQLFFHGGPSIWLAQCTSLIWFW